jgi:ABC-type polysaccharide/polyol phosphate transport system ATPase subunit
MIEAKDLGKVFKIYLRPRYWLGEKLTGRKMHREVTALSGVNLRAEAGECLGVIGSNGAGKSTLLRLLAGISPPTSGTIKSGGRVSAILELDSGFHPEFTGRENIRVGASILGLSTAEARSREEEIIAFSELEDFIDLPVRTYSAGMYLRLGFSLATAVDPAVLLVDEALAVGDEWFRGKCVDRILSIKDKGATIVIVSHDLTLVRALCDHAVLLSRGRVAAAGKTMDVINAYLERIYEDAARSAGDSIFPSERPRRGTGELEITAVRIKDGAGRPSAVLHTGEPMVIELDYRAHHDCASPLFGVNIFRADNVLAVCTNSEASHYSNEKYRPGEPAGDHPDFVAAGRTGTARFLIAHNPLLAGDYELSVNVYRGRSGAHVAVDEILGVARFQVISGDHPDRGLLLCPGRWEIT